MILPLELIANIFDFIFDHPNLRLINKFFQQRYFEDFRKIVLEKHLEYLEEKNLLLYYENLQNLFLNLESIKTI